MNTNSKYKYDDGYMYEATLGNILSSIHEKVKQHWDWKKSVAYKKSVYMAPYNCLWQNNFWKNNIATLFLF